MKHISFVIGCMFFLALLGACEKVSDNGELDGLWHLTTITDTEGHVNDVSSYQRFWAFQLDLMNLRSHTENIIPNYKEALARFQVKGSKLCITDIYLHPWADRINADDSLVVDESTNVFQIFGIWGCRDTFDIQCLTSSTMQLKSNHAQLSFRKF